MTDNDNITARKEKSTGHIETDTVFKLLSNERRRLAIKILDERGPLTKADLAEFIASIQNDKPIPELNSQDRKRVLVSLMQSHLDKLVEAEVVTIEGDMIRLTAKAQDLIWYLEHGPEDSLSDTVKLLVKRLF